ncbi:MAG: ATP-binding cassette domain-containing protein [Candidatus Omnitrophica bacterium]|nr:ATP-binding cassette domain-containing protein [Candidatus Omnitrophota bacterium]
MMSKKQSLSVKLGEILVDKGVITNEELTSALEEQKDSGIELGEILVGRGFPREEITKAFIGQRTFGEKVIVLKKYLKFCGMDLSILISTPVLSFFVAFFDGLSIGLLIPILKGIIDKNFSFVFNVPILKTMFTMIPKRYIDNNSGIFLILLSMVFFSACVQQIMRLIAANNISSIKAAVHSAVRKKIFGRYMDFGILFFENNSYGHLSNILINFPERISIYLAQCNNLIIGMFTLVVYLIWMLCISWKMTLFVLLIFPLANLLIKKALLGVKNLSKKQVEKKRILGAKAHNVLTCMHVVKSYSMEKNEEAIFNDLSDEDAKVGLLLEKRSNFIMPIQQIIMLCLMIGLLCAVAFLVMKDKSADMSKFLVFFFLLKKTANSSELINNFRTILAGIQGPINTILNVFSDEDKPFVFSGKKQFQGFEKEIRFNDLDFSYVSGQRILENINFSVPKGKMLAIVGPSGSGKTTIVKLLLRLYDIDMGAILVDGTDIRDFTLESLRKKIAFVSQDVSLFNDTLRANIVYGCGDVSDEDLKNVIIDAKLTEYINHLPDGLDSILGDYGTKLSGGEKQRVSIARAMLKKSDILILDEATSALDTTTEILIQEAIEKLVEGKTSIVIAHRLSTIMNAHKIVILENGRIVEKGLYQDLVAKRGEFYKYLEKQNLIVKS